MALLLQGVWAGDHWVGRVARRGGLWLAFGGIRRPEFVSGVGTPQQFEWLRGIVKAVVVLNLLDAVFTLAWVRTGHAYEANALLRDLVSDSALAFVLSKLALVSLGVLLLWRYRDRPMAVVAIFLSFFVYFLIFLHHLQYTGFLLRIGLRG